MIITDSRFSVGDTVHYYFDGTLTVGQVTEVIFIDNDYYYLIDGGTDAIFEDKLEHHVSGDFDLRHLNWDSELETWE